MSTKDDHRKSEELKARLGQFLEVAGDQIVQDDAAKLAAIEVFVQQKIQEVVAAQNLAALSVCFVMDWLRPGTPEANEFSGEVIRRTGDLMNEKATIDNKGYYKELPNVG